MVREAWGFLKTFHGEVSDCPDFVEWLMAIRARKT